MSPGLEGESQIAFSDSLRELLASSIPKRRIWGIYDLDRSQGGETMRWAHLQCRQETPNHSWVRGYPITKDRGWPKTPHQRTGCTMRHSTSRNADRTPPCKTPLNHSHCRKRQPGCCASPSWISRRRYRIECPSSRAVVCGNKHRR